MLKVVLRIFAMLALIGGLSGLVYFFYTAEKPEYDPFLNIAFVDTVGEADCIVLWQKDFAMMIDTGEERDADTILAFLAEKNITKLDYLVLTHPDKDHIGSAPNVIRALKVNKVIQPFYQKENTRNRDLQTRLAQGKIKAIVPARVLHYIVNDMDIYVYPPMERNYSLDNNYSLAVFVRHRNVSALFPGDAENKRLEELMRLEWGAVDLYKLPRHGRYSENSRAFFSSLRPAYSVVTARKVSESMTDTADGREGWETEWLFSRGRTLEFLSDGETLLKA